VRRNKKAANNDIGDSNLGMTLYIGALYGL